LPDFGLALEEIQDRVGRAFAPAQHGLFAHPVSAEIVSFLRTAGLHGVGQSSWGPTLYGFLHCQHPQRHAIREQVLERFPIDPTRVFWTRASRTGCRSRLLTPPSDEGTA
jgi:predicted sugar kinase